MALTLSKERRGEIVEILFVEFLLEKGFNISGQMKRELGSLAKETGIPLEEIKEVVLSVGQKVLEKAIR